MPDPASYTTSLLQQARNGSASAAGTLQPVIYDALLSLARRRLADYRPGQTLNTTALVHEAYLKLIDQSEAAWQDRTHFFALASRIMRNILIDYARARSAAKRGGGQEAVPIDAIQVAAEDRTHDLLALDEALDRLGLINERLGRLVEYRFFAGLTYDEIAAMTGTSAKTAKRDWQRARTWLYRLMQDTP